MDLFFVLLIALVALGAWLLWKPTATRLYFTITSTSNIKKRLTHASHVSHAKYQPTPVQLSQYVKQYQIPLTAETIADQAVEALQTPLSELEPFVVRNLILTDTLGGGKVTMIGYQTRDRKRDFVYLVNKKYILHGLTSWSQDHSSRKITILRAPDIPTGTELVEAGLRTATSYTGEIRGPTNQ